MKTKLITYKWFKGERYYCKNIGSSHVIETEGHTIVWLMKVLARSVYF